MLNNSFDRPSVEEREKYKVWKEFNKMWNMVKIDMQGVGGMTPVLYF